MGIPMSDINIDLRKMRNASAKLATKEYMFSNLRRTMGLIRWKLPEEIKQKKEIDKRIEKILKQIQTAEELMHDIKTTTNSCISQYAQAENRLTENANKFI